MPSRERLPLDDRTVVVTRPRAQAEAMSRRLRELGARVLEAPTIEILDPEDRGRLREALGRLDGFDWVVFTSVNGVEKVREAMEEMGLGAEAFAGRRVACIGPSTASALRPLGLEADVVPAEYRAEALAEAIRATASGPGSDGALDGRRVLLARAAEAREALPEALVSAGAEVEEVAAYRTVPATGAAGELRQALGAGEVDWLTFTASSTVRNFVDLVGTEIGGARVAAIGPVTARTASELGLPVDVVAGEYTIPGLVDALVRAERDGGSG